MCSRPTSLLHRSSVLAACFISAAACIAAEVLCVFGKGGSLFLCSSGISVLPHQEPRAYAPGRSLIHGFGLRLFPGSLTLSGGAGLDAVLPAVLFSWLDTLLLCREPGAAFISVQSGPLEKLLALVFSRLLELVVDDRKLGSFLSDRRVDGSARVLVSLRRRTPSPAWRPLRFYPSGQPQITFLRLPRNPLQSPSVSLAKKHTKNRGYTGFPTEHCHISLRFSFLDADFLAPASLRMPNCDNLLLSK